MIEIRRQVRTSLRVNSNGDHLADAGFFLFLRGFLNLSNRKPEARSGFLFLNSSKQKANYCCDGQGSFLEKNSNEESIHVFHRRYS